MLAVAASRLSPSDIWRCKDEKSKSKGSSTLESRRSRRGSKESGEMKEAWKESAETKGTLGSWRVRKQEKAEGVVKPGVYGDCMPAEWKLQRMYKQLKLDTNKFTTWLVESVYPCSENLPCNERLPHYITSSRKQARSSNQPDRTMVRSAILISSTDYSKYEIIVNNITELARKIEQVPPTIMDLLDQVIVERTEYSHWMSRKSTDVLAKFANESHLYYVKVLNEVKTILTERVEPRTETSSPAEPQKPANTANASKSTSNPTLGKRKNSSTSHPNPDPRKAAKHLDTTQKQQEDEWRMVVVDRCSKATEKSCAGVVKPMSYAAAVRVAITA